MKTALKTITIVALIMVGRPVIATPASPDITVSFDVTNPNFSIIATLTDNTGGNATSTTAECAVNGSGYTYGSMESSINTETGWTSTYGGFYGSQVNMSSTFQVQGIRNVEGASSTFTTTQGVSATNVGPLEFSPTDQLISGMYLYGEAGANSTTDTWALGLGQTFEGTADSVTGTAENLFEQRDSTGALIGDPVNNQFTVDNAGGDRFTGSSEGGSYDGSAFGLSNPPGYGFTASSFYLDAQNGSSTTNTNVLFFTDKTVGDTATWYEYPDYPNP